MASAAEADTVSEATNPGTKILSFSTLTTSVVLNLGSSAVQTVHANMTLKLNATNTFENALGGSGNDILEGGGGRDILIGGWGLDTLNGRTGDDILIAGRSTNEGSFDNLITLRTQWISANTFAARIAI